MRRINAVVVRILLPIVVISVVIPAPLVSAADVETTLTDTGRLLEARYSKLFDNLQQELRSRIPQETATPERFLADDSRDAALVRCVVLLEATPRGLAAFAQQSPAHRELVDRLLADPALLKEMLIADGAAAPPQGRGYGPAQYGPAMEIYTAIRQTSPRAAQGIFHRLALAIALEHAVPVAQSNPEAQTDAPTSVGPVKRYLHYEKAYLDGELDPAFDRLSTWELRFVVNGDEPDEILSWGREMLRNYRPDHIYTPNYGWRYVGIVRTDVKYGSENVKFDRPELQKYQNILMNGGVCGRRAFFGRFILRAFGIPTIARPSTGHAALAHWTPQGWVVCLGGGWGAGWTKTRYRKDLDFLATTQARRNPEAFVKVKRAQWIADVWGEQRVYGEHDGTPGFWNAVALRTQRAVVEASKTEPLAALGEELGEADEPTTLERFIAAAVPTNAKQITYAADGTILIPAAAHTKPGRNTSDVVAMKSFDGGIQVFLPRFFPEGKTILRGGTWKGDPDACTSGKRMLSGGYGKYENWGFRVAVTPRSNTPPRELKLDLGDGVTLELVYITPGTFIMGGENTVEGRFECVEVPKHEVTLTRGYYLGKYEVTQAQYQAVMGTNPSRSTKAPDCPVDNIGESDAVAFCTKLSEMTGYEVRLPTEAEWEYAARAGTTTKWFFGDDPSLLHEYAWYKENAEAKSHPVGQKKPNPFGLYDIYGNVCERVADKYDRNYYAQSPKVDPTGPQPGTKSHLEYVIRVPRSGTYALSARVVTVGYGQRLNVSTDGGKTSRTIELPFTAGMWQETAPIPVSLTAGENTLTLWRDKPPQLGMVVKAFTLKPMDAVPSSGR
ncbi:hypothetical protein JCM19992_00530 [Thermostilla marina]